MREELPAGPDTEGGREGSRLPHAARRLLRVVLRVPLVYKILLANAAIVAAAVVGALLLLRTYPELREASPAVLTGGSAALALVIGGAVNFLIVRLAFLPLRELEEAAERVAAGNMEVRATPPAVADRRLRQLIGVFNGMLDRVAAERKRRRRLAVQALGAEERARRQLAAALHNETAQRLATHVLRLKQIKDLSSVSEKDRLLDEVREEAVETLEGVRRTARGLHPPELEELGVGPALQAFVRTKGTETDAEFEVEAQDRGQNLPDEHRVALYRILQEGVSNAVEHAAADRIRVRIGRYESHIGADVTDDGRGFDVTAAESDPASGLGLLSMREQAAALGGHVRIDSRPGTGTRVRVRLPLPTSEDAPAEEGS